jgi:hypothetical protein
MEIILISFGIFMIVNILFGLILRHFDYRGKDKNEGRNKL